MDSDASFSQKKLVECRISQAEDVNPNMETPCSCCGSLKYAHRKCIQRWCDEKGDTVCEICHQHFKPGYTAPPPIVHIGGLLMNLRENWHVPHIIAMVSTDPSFLDPDYDEHAVSTSRSTPSCHSAVIIFMFLLVLRHTLPIIASRAERYSFPVIMLLMLRVATIVLPVWIILKAVTSILHREHQQANLYIPPSDEEAGPLSLSQPHVLGIR